jgi:hypothetical protein
MLIILYQIGLITFSFSARAVALAVTASLRMYAAASFIRVLKHDFELVVFAVG